MPRPKTPSAIADAKGYYLKHPERRPKDEPMVRQGLGTAPKHMSASEKKTWKELARMIPPGVAMFSDRASFERLVRMFAQDRAGTLRVTLAGRLDSLLSKFGMTPSDRAKVSAGEGQKESKLAAFLSRKPEPEPEAVPPGTPVQ